MSERQRVCVSALAAHQTQDLTQVAPPHDPIYIKPFLAMKFTTQHVLYWNSCSILRYQKRFNLNSSFHVRSAAWLIGGTVAASRAALASHQTRDHTQVPREHLCVWERERRREGTPRENPKSVKKREGERKRIRERKNERELLATHPPSCLPPHKGAPISRSTHWHVIAE